MATKKPATTKRSVKLAALNAAQKRRAAKGGNPGSTSDLYKLQKCTEKDLATAIQALKAAIEKAFAKDVAVTNVKKTGGLKVAFPAAKKLSATISPRWTRQHPGVPPHLLDYDVRLAVLDLEADAKRVAKWHAALAKLLVPALEAIP